MKRHTLAILICCLLLPLFFLFFRPDFAQGWSGKILGKKAQNKDTQIFLEFFRNTSPDEMKIQRELQKKLQPKHLLSSDKDNSLNTSQQETPSQASELEKKTASKESAPNPSAQSSVAVQSKQSVGTSSGPVDSGSQIQASFTFYSVPNVLFSSHRLSDGWVFIPGQIGLANKKSGEPKKDPPMIATTINGIQSFPAFVRFIKTEQANKWIEAAQKLHSDVRRGPVITLNPGSSQEISDVKKNFVCSSVFPVFGKYATAFQPLIDELYEGITIQIKAELCRDHSVQIDSQITLSDILNNDVIMAVSDDNDFSSDESQTCSIQMKTVEYKTVEINRLTVPSETHLLFALPQMEDFRNMETIKNKKVRASYLLISLNLKKP